MKFGALFIGSSSIHYERFKNKKKNFQLFISFNKQEI